MNDRARSYRRSTQALAAVSAGIASFAMASTANAWCRPSAESVTAHTRDDDPAYQECRWRERVGAEATLQVGMGMGFDPSNRVYVFNPDAQGQRNGPGFAMNVGLGWRVIPALSFGAHLYFQYSPSYGLRTTPVTRGQTDYTPTGGNTNIIGTGLYARLYIGSALGIRRFDPWVSAGFDFAAPVWVATYIHTVTNMAPLDTTGTTTIPGVAVPLAVGVDWNVSPLVSIGLMGQVSIWIPYGRCGNVTAANSSPSCTYPADGWTVAPYPLLFVGAQARFLSPF
jgi:hypothetical protein